MSRHPDILPATLCVALLCGCAANPVVIYEKIAAPDYKGAVRFKFAHSVIQFTSATESTTESAPVKAGVTPPPKAGARIVSYDIKSVPVTAATDDVYSITGVGLTSNFGVATVLTVKRRPDSDLIQQISVKVNDQRVAIIQSAVGLATAVAPLAFAAEGGPKPPDPPSQIDVSEELAVAAPGCFKSKNSGWDIQCTKSYPDGAWSAVIDYGPKPKDAFDASVLNSKYKSNSFIYAACRDAHVKLLYNGKNTLPLNTVPQITLPEATVKVADPRYLQTLALPASGTVTAADSCGADSSADAATSSSALDIANALVKGAQSIKDAANKKSPSGGGTPHK